jgi:hypothetical protein
MLTCRPTRLRTLTDSDPAYANLCLKSAPNKPGYPSNLPQHLVGASLGGPTPATPIFSCARSDVSTIRGRHSIPIHPPR